MTSKLALRSVTWQGLVLLITPVYICTTLALGAALVSGGVVVLTSVK